MAQKVIIDLEAKTDAAVKEIADLKKEIQKLNQEVAEGNKDTKDGLKDVEKASEKTAGGVKKIGGALKAAGIGLAIAAFAKFTEVLNENQKVTDFFSTTFETLSLAFNDFFNFIDTNAGVIINYFKGIFQDPIGAIKDFGVAIKNNLIERFNSALDTLGFLASAVKKVFSGDFAGALDDAKNAGKELVDVVTGVDDSFDKTVEVTNKVVQATKSYVTETVRAAKANVELDKSAEIARVRQQGLIESYDRQAEKLRQVRDDEAKTIEERIKANEDLGKVLDEQEAAMLKQVELQIAAAQAQYDVNKNQENYIALLEAQNEKEAVLAQIEGFRSEQLTNINSLERERQDFIKDAADKEIELAEQVAEAKNQAITTGLQGAIALVGQNSKFGKGLAIAQAIRDTYAGATKALAQGGIFGGIAAAGIIAAGLANVRTITATSDPTPPSFATGSIGGGTGGIQAPSAPPAFNVVGTSGANQLAGAIASQQQQPVKAFVVSNDVTTAQELDRNIVSGATIG